MTKIDKDNLDIFRQHYDNSEKIAVIGNNVEYIKKDMDEIKLHIINLSTKFIRREEFEPIKKIVYGLISFILIGFITAISALVFK